MRDFSNTHHFFVIGIFQYLTESQLLDCYFGGFKSSFSENVLCPALHGGAGFMGIYLHHLV